MIRIGLILLVIVLSPPLGFLIVIFLLLRELFKRISYSTQIDRGTIIACVILAIALITIFGHTKNESQNSPEPLLFTIAIGAIIYLYFKYKTKYSRLSSFQKGQNLELQIRQMDGRQFEHLIEQKINNFGWRTRLMPYQGDKGADIIAWHDDISVAVQCKKRSSGNIGNNAVQEVFTAMHLYQCTYGCVVTNSAYTNAADEAASQLGIALLHYSELGAYLRRLAATEHM